MTDDEINVLLPELKKVSEETFCHAVMALNTGMRAGEIWGLTWADVDLENSILTLRDTKNRKTRIAYLNDITSRLLTDRKPKNPDPSGLVFPGKGGGKIDKISRTFKRVADRIGLNAGITDPRQKIVFHSCRHTFASRLVKNHVDIYVVKELLGHSRLKQTSRYAHNAPENLMDAVNSLSRGETNKATEGEGGAIPFQKLA